VLTALLLGVIATVIVLLAAGTHRTPPKTPGVTTTQEKGARPLISVPLSASQAHDYDPYGTGGEHPELVHNVVDGDPTTAWNTESYNAGLGTKPGVGLYVDAGSGIQARRLDVTANPSDYEARVYAAPSGAVPTNLDGWTSVSSLIPSVGDRAQITIDTQGKSYQYYLLWITKLPPGGKAGIAELKLLR
jgi:hypothetical protein